MPLSDLFKKSPKKESDKNNPLSSPEIQRKRYDAAMEFLNVFQEKIPLVRGKPHAGTVLSTAARIAGTSLYRSMNYTHDVAPGTIVLSEEVNKAWSQLMNLFALYCKQNGIDVLSKPLVTKFPEKDKPRLETAFIQTEYQDQYNEIMRKYGLDYLEGARAGMVFCSIVFQYHCIKIKDIDPHVAAGIIAMGIVEGAKTAPPPFGSPKLQIPPKNNNRLVLGEDEVAAKEARENGGIFIQLSPTALKKMQLGNIDPYVIYEQGLLNQIEAKIPRIDFVEANVNELFDEWKSKPEKQIPIYIRLLIWLKNHALAHGYEQSGNSWLRK